MQMGAKEQGSKHGRRASGLYAHAESSGRRDGITHVGGPSDGPWLLSRLEILYRLNREVDKVFTLVEGTRTDIVVRGEVPHQFVQSRSGDEWTTTLLSMPACPAATPAPSRRWRRTRTAF